MMSGYMLMVNAYIWYKIQNIFEIFILRKGASCIFMHELCDSLTSFTTWLL